MSYYLYLQEWNKTLTYQKKYPIFGKNGPIARCLKSRNYNRVSKIIAGGEIKFGKFSKESRFVIDIDPKAEHRIFLMMIESMYSYTHDDKRFGKVDNHWTVLALQLRERANIHGDDLKKLQKEDNSETFKKFKNKLISRIEPTPENTKVTEFIYLKKGNLGKPGRTNAALLYPESLEAFKNHLFK